MCFLISFLLFPQIPWNCIHSDKCPLMFMDFHRASIDAQRFLLSFIVFQYSIDFHIDSLLFFDFQMFPSSLQYVLCFQLIRVGFGNISCMSWASLFLGILAMLGACFGNIFGYALNMVGVCFGDDWGKLLVCFVQVLGRLWFMFWHVCGMCKACLGHLGFYKFCSISFYILFIASTCCMPQISTHFFITRIWMG